MLIKLPRAAWQFDPELRLGSPGGFGEVFEGVASDGGAVAVKRLKLTAGDAAHRELRIAEQLASREHANVLPILDAGQDADSDRYFVVMPLAEHSLQDELERRGRFAERDAVEVLLHIAQGLREVQDLVHRDLKPANVLFHAGAWKIADFGIARFVEESTSTNTLRECLSPAYAAPEQWRGEHATAATDIYALGCVAYALLSGEPPFRGGAIADFRAAHLNNSPPELQVDDPRLRGLVAGMLRKPPESRPSVDRVIGVLTAIGAQPYQHSNAHAELQRASAAEAERRARAAAEGLLAAERRQRRRALADAGWRALEPVIQQLGRTAKEHAPEAEVSVTSCRIRISLGSASLVTGVDDRPIPESAMPNCKWDPVVLATIGVEQKQGREWSHGATLWYMRFGGNADYRWYEVSYRQHPLRQSRILAGPFAQTDVNDADLAAGPGMHVTEIESGPTPIDDENTEQFIDRWLDRLARAYHGKLQPF